MNISSFNFINFTGSQKVNKVKANTQNVYMTQPLKKDTFTKSNSFNINASIYTLSSIKDENNKPKFKENHLKTIKNELQTEPKKWDAINSLANNKKINAEFVYMMAMQPLDKLNELKEYSEIKNKKGEPKYSGKEMMNFNDNITAEGLQRVKPLTNTALSSKCIVELANDNCLPEMNKLSNKILEFENEQKFDVEEVSLVKDNYLNDELLMSAKGKDIVMTKAFNNELKPLYAQKVVTDNEKEMVKTITKDYRNNTTSETIARMDNYVGRPVVIEETRVIKNNDGEIKRIEKITPSEIEGILNVTHTDDKGNVKVISSGTVDKKTGITSIKKDMISLDGTRTEYLYENDPMGNRIMDYKITDKNGKVLLKKSESFEVLNKNEFISSKNNEKYSIKVGDKEINVQDLNNENRKASFKIGKEIKDKPEQLMNTLKQLSGNQLIKLRDNIDTLNGIDESLDSFYNGAVRTIYTGDNAYLLIHEIGHSIDFKDTDSTSNEAYEKTLKNTITKNKEVNKAYNEEVENFVNAFPNTQRGHIDYFINQYKHPAGDDGGIGETIAESNALSTTPKTVEALSYRAHYLQQYFPRTIAEAIKKLD